MFSSIKINNQLENEDERHAVELPNGKFYIRIILKKLYILINKYQNIIPIRRRVNWRSLN